jgi:cysteine synthase
VRQFDNIGISGLANIVAAIKFAKHFDLDANDVVMTVATDSAEMYASERQSYLARRYPDGFDEVNAGEIFGQHLDGVANDHVLELTFSERKRIFNLGYYTWVEQQGVSVEDFDARKDQSFWRALVSTVPVWDRMIEAMNEEVGAARH